MGSVDKSLVLDLIQESIDVKSKILNDDAFIQDIYLVGLQCVDVLNSGNRIILAGNGGSAADAQHIAAEFVSRFEFDRPGLPSISLSTDSSMLTAIGNDYGFDQLFSRQLEANGREGDLFIGISTSGNSLNVVNALKSAKKMNIACIGLTGGSSCEFDDLCDSIIKVPSRNTARIQEAHIMIGHAICSIVEKSIFGKK